ncbi:hypothetical protein [Lapidilactobacillus gannanensis]|uniref:Uncharacterized protein n=1 Tax=Lapidilactobacillus gannanensis TaxID=2486002 RepID=A0ABW4BIW2_9LACO|nr:hypothetical protein [Lapidilactobacillus gannanensis]
MFGKKKTAMEPIQAANLFTITEPMLVLTEQIKTVRTNISFA